MKLNSEKQTDTHNFKLKDGRNLSYREIGSRMGRPLLFFHGFPGSSVQATVVPNPEVYTPFHLIAVDRPGFGASEHDPNRTHLSFAQDLQQLLNFLKIDEAHLLAVSGGSPYAFATAQLLGSRALSLNAVGGLGPLVEGDFMKEMKSFAKWGLKVSSRSDIAAVTLMTLLQSLITRREKKPAIDKGFKFLLRGLPAADKEFILNDELRAKFRASMKHSFLNGPKGSAKDLQLMTQDWGVDFKNLKVPVRLWHGALDTIVPARHSIDLAARIPQAELRVLENEGHYSVPLGRLGLILRPLLEV